MIQPGSNGWIKKYISLIKSDQISLDIDLPDGADEQSYLHASIGRTGLCFGHATRFIFAKNISDKRWTNEERLQFLLLEAHLLCYRVRVKEDFNTEDFIDALVDFYGKHSDYSISKLFTFFLKESKEEQLENILEKRVDIKVKYLENKIWINYLNNVFSYLDVILFNEFLQHRKSTTFFNYDEMAMNALTAIILSIHSDGNIESNEKSLFSLFLASANLSETQRYVIEKRFKEGASFNDFTASPKKNWLFRRFIIDLSSFIIYANHEALPEEKVFLMELCFYMGYEENEYNESLALTEQFIIENQKTLPFLKSSSTIEKVYSSLSKRWIKVLGRNKDKLATELKQSKELVYLIKKSTVSELSKEEKEIVKTQFLDIVKSMPSLAIFMLPGGAFLLPIVLKIIPDLIPSAFRDNEVKKDDL